METFLLIVGLTILLMVLTVLLVPKETGHCSACYKDIPEWQGICDSCYIEMMKK